MDNMKQYMTRLIAEGILYLDQCGFKVTQSELFSLDYASYNFYKRLETKLASTEDDEKRLVILFLMDKCSCKEEGKGLASLRPNYIAG